MATCPAEQAAHIASFLTRDHPMLEVYDDETLFMLGHSQVLHDPNGEFAALRARYAFLPDEIIRGKIAAALSFLDQHAFVAHEVLHRYQPLAWMEHVSGLLHLALELCCWLDRQAPTGRKWLMKQAETCSSAPVLLPAVRRVVEETGKALSLEEPPAGGSPALLGAVTALGRAAWESTTSAGFADVPRWSPPAS